MLPAVYTCVCVWKDVRLVEWHAPSFGSGQGVGRGVAVTSSPILSYQSMSRRFRFLPLTLQPPNTHT